RFTDVFDEAFEIHSARTVDVEPTDSQQYIRDLIDGGYMLGGTVLIVLLGAQTYARKIVDWEIAAALETKPTRASGVIGIRIPNHPDFGKATVNPARLPKRLAENVKSGFCAIRDWTETPAQLQTWITEATRNALHKTHLVDNTADHLKRDILR
ncbi:MAG TPA: TIR domain-containing protein, partial [bacterium]